MNGESVVCYQQPVVLLFSESFSPADASDAHPEPKPILIANSGHIDSWELEGKKPFWNL